MILLSSKYSDSSLCMILTVRQTFRCYFPYNNQAPPVDTKCPSAVQRKQAKRDCI